MYRPDRVSPRGRRLHGPNGDTAYGNAHAGTNPDAHRHADRGADANAGTDNRANANSYCDGYAARDCHADPAPDPDANTTPDPDANTTAYAEAFIPDRRLRLIRTSDSRVVAGQSPHIQRRLHHRHSTRRNLQLHP